MLVLRGAFRPREEAAVNLWLPVGQSHLPIILTLSIGVIFPISTHAKTYKKDDQIVIKNPAYTNEFQERERKIKRKAQEIKEKKYDL